MRYSETEEFLTFRLKTFPPISAKELKDVLFQAVSLPEGLEKDVATIVFEEKCMESINAFRKDLASVGYKELIVIGRNGYFEVRALPQIPTHSLWLISSRYFPTHTSRGSTAECDFQTIDNIRFPSSLIHAYCLCEKCLL